LDKSLFKTLIICSFMATLVLFLDCIEIFISLNENIDVLFLFDYSLNVGYWSNLLILICQFPLVLLPSLSPPKDLLKVGIVGGISIAIGCTLFCCINTLWLPLVDVNGSEFQSFLMHYNMTEANNSYFCLTPLILSNYNIAYFIASIYFVFLLSTLWSIVGYTIYLFVKNKYVTVFITYMLYYYNPLLIGMINKLTGSSLYTSKNLFLGNFNFGVSIFGNILYLTVFVLLALVLIWGVICKMHYKVP